MATMTVGGNLRAPKTSLKELSLYNQAQPSLSDFQMPIDQAAPVSNAPSNSNTAVIATALNPDGDPVQQMIDNYKTAVAEGSNYGQSAVATTLISKSQDQALSQNTQGLLDVMGNPSISDESKMAATQAVFDRAHTMYSPANMLSTKVLSQPTKEDDGNNEVDNYRFKIADVTTEINDNKNQVQKILNSALTASDPSLQQHVFDLGMNLVPGARQYMTAKIQAAQNDSSIIPAFIKTLIQGTGSTTADIRDHISSLPMDQQVAAAQNIADIINQHSNVLISTPNDEFRREQLQNILGGQGYTNKDELADNVASWMDALFVGGPVAKGAKALYSGAKDIGAAVKAGSILGDSRDFFRSFEENYAVAKEATPADVVSGVAGQTTKTSAKPSLSEFQKSRETQFYDSSNGIPYQKLPPETKLSNAIRDGLRSGVQPVSYFNNVKDMNSDVARAAFQGMVQDTSGTLSEALTGASRADAIASPMLPEVAHVDGSVASKVGQIDGPLTMAESVPPEVMDFLNRDGFTQYSLNEKAAANSYVKNNFQDAVGMTPRGEMFQYLPDMSRVTDTPQGFHFVGVYGPQNSGFSNAADALESARFALRNSGVDENSITLLRRDGDRYIPSTLEEAEASGVNDYLVSVDHKYKLNSRDVEAANGWEPLNVKMNFFDRMLTFSGKAGSLASHLVDKASQLHKSVVGSAVVGVDRAVGAEKAWLRNVGDMATSWKSMDKGLQQTLLDEIADANMNSRPYNYARLTARGIPQEGIDWLQKLQSTNDGIWHMKNSYYAQQLDKAGWTEFVHPSTNTNLPVKEVRVQAQASGVSKVYDPSTDTIQPIIKADVDQLYSQGGTMGRLRQPIITPNGESAEHVMIRNNPNDGYTRRFTPGSKVLNYRPGYYGIQYKDPFHIVERVPDANGNVVFERSVATAKDTPMAKTQAARMNSTGVTPTLADGKPRFYYRKAREHDPNALFNDQYDIDQAQGMSSFKRRGKLLEDSNSNVTSLQDAYVANPIEVMVRQIQQVTNRAAMQDVIDAQVRRGINQYGDLLPKDRFGDPLIPTDLRQITNQDGAGKWFNSGAVADARTTFGYTNYLQHGYANALNDVQKSLFHMVADKFGEAGLGRVERVARGVGDKSLNNGLKSMSYYAYMGTSPLHQIVLQGQQAAMTAALNPGWLGSIKAFSQPGYIALRALGIDANHSVASALAKTAWGSIRDAEEAYAQWVRTGLGAAVDHQNLVTGAVNDMAQNMIASTAGTIASKALAVPRALAGASRKLGFDAGEYYSSLMSWLAHRDLYAKNGMDVLNDAVADQVHAAARNFTGNMNKAGAMPYDKNALGFTFQYMSNQHKMLMNLVSNRAIPWQTKASMVTLGTALYGVGQWHIFDGPAASIKNTEARETVRYGLEGWALNKMLEHAFGGKSEIDWSSLSPFNASGFLDSLYQMATQRNIGAIIANTPSTSMLFGNNPRITNAYQSALAYMHLRDDYQDNTSLLQVAKDFANISSGFSSAMKARYILQLQQKVGSNGKVSADDVDKVNAIGAALGFNLQRESQLWQVQQDMLSNKKQVESDFNEWYRLANQHYSDQNLTGSDLDHAQRMLNEFYRAYGTDNPLFNEMMDKKLKQDIAGGKSAMFSSILRNCQLYNKGDCLDLINKAPFSDENSRETLKQIVTYGNTFKPEQYDNKEK